jgi:DNA-binding NarL/FixJ family response regulator
MVTATRALIADDHATVRAGVRALLATMPEVQVVGEADDLQTVLEGVRALEPELLVLDLAMPGSGVKTIKAVFEVRPEMRILVFTMHLDLVYLRAVLSAGAHGYLTKTAVSGELKRAVRVVLSGRTYIDPAFRVSPGEPRALRTELSPREVDVLRALAEGYTQREIGERLELSARTVETYRERLSDKLQLTSRADLVRYALETGILVLQSSDPLE